MGKVAGLGNATLVLAEVGHKCSILGDSEAVDGIRGHLNAILGPVIEGVALVRSGCQNASCSRDKGAARSDRATMSFGFSFVSTPGKADVVEVILGISSILRRIEIHGFQTAANHIITISVQTPLPFVDKHFIFAWSSVVIACGVGIGIHMQAEVHPCIVHAWYVSHAVTTRMDGAVTRSLSRARTVVGHVEIALESPGAVITSEVVHDVEVTVLALGHQHIKCKLVDTVSIIAEKQYLVVTIGEVATLVAVIACNNAIFGAAGKIVPSGPPIVACNNVFISNLVANSVLLEVV